MKRLQRYNVIFPKIFPKLLNYGNIAYFDIEYFPNAINAQEYLYNCKDKAQIDTFFDILIETMSKLHIHEMLSSQGAMELYVNENKD